MHMLINRDNSLKDTFFLKRLQKKIREPELRYVVHGASGFCSIYLITINHQYVTIKGMFY